MIGGAANQAAFQAFDCQNTSPAAQQADHDRIKTVWRYATGGNMVIPDLNGSPVWVN